MQNPMMVVRKRDVKLEEKIMEKYEKSQVLISADPVLKNQTQNDENPSTRATQQIDQNTSKSATPQEAIEQENQSLNIFVKDETLSESSECNASLPDKTQKTDPQSIQAQL